MEHLYQLNYGDCIVLNKKIEQEECQKIFRLLYVKRNFSFPKSFKDFLNFKSWIFGEKLYFYTFLGNSGQKGENIYDCLARNLQTF